MKAAGLINSSTPTRGKFSLFFLSPQLNLLTRWEFGGPWGVTAMMIGFPMLMYYLWICLWFYDGQLVLPTSIGDIQPFLNKMWAHVRDVSSLLFPP